MKPALRIDPGELVVIEDTPKAGVYRRRRLSIFERWHREGKITRNHLEAAKIFNFDFETAQLGNRYSTISLEKIHSSAGHDHYNIKMVEAKKRIRLIFESVGELSQKLLWDFVGLEQPIAKRNNDSREIFGSLKIVLDEISKIYKL